MKTSIDSEISKFIICIVTYIEPSFSVYLNLFRLHRNTRKIMFTNRILYALAPCNSNPRRTPHTSRYRLGRLIT